MNKRLEDVLEKYKGSHDIEKSDISYVLLEEILTNRFKMEESNKLFLEKTKEVLEKMEAFSSKFNEGDFEIGMETIELTIDYAKIAQEVVNVLEKKEE